MPIDYSKYPPDWEERRARILKRANDKCERCGIDNYTIGYRDGCGYFYKVTLPLEPVLKHKLKVKKYKVIKIVLTIAHLDHDPENWEVKDNRLAALCQRCHLQYDATHRKQRNRYKKAIGDLFNG